MSSFNRADSLGAHNAKVGGMRIRPKKKLI